MQWNEDKETPVRAEAAHTLQSLICNQVQAKEYMKLHVSPVMQELLQIFRDRKQWHYCHPEDDTQVQSGGSTNFSPRDPILGWVLQKDEYEYEYEYEEVESKTVLAIKFYIVLILF